MRNYYIFIAFLSAFCLGLIIMCFTLAGSPTLQKDLRLDRTRMSDFSRIESAVNQYYQTNKAFPPSLSSLTENDTTLIIKDPETKTDYEYKTVPPYSYQLCAVFALDSKEDPSFSSYSAGSNSNKHTKGQDCITYTIPEYYQPTPITEIPDTTTQGCNVIEVDGTVTVKTDGGYVVKPDVGLDMTITNENYGRKTLVFDNPQVNDKVKVLRMPDCQFSIAKM